MAKAATAVAEAQARAEARRQSISGRSNLVARLPASIDAGEYTYDQLNAVAPAGMAYCTGCEMFRSLPGQHREARRWHGHRCPDCVSDANADYYADNRGRMLGNLNAKREPERMAKAQRRTFGGDAQREGTQREERRIDRQARNRAEREFRAENRLRRAPPAVQRAARSVRTSPAGDKNKGRIDQGGAGRRPGRSSRRGRN